MSKSTFDPPRRQAGAGRAAPRAGRIDIGPAAESFAEFLAAVNAGKFAEARRHAQALRRMGLSCIYMGRRDVPRSSSGRGGAE